MGKQKAYRGRVRPSNAVLRKSTGKGTPRKRAETNAHIQQRWSGVDEQHSTGNRQQQSHHNYGANNEEEEGTVSRVRRHVCYEDILVPAPYESDIFDSTTIHRIPCDNPNICYALNSNTTEFLKGACTTDITAWLRNDQCYMTPTCFIIPQHQYALPSDKRLGIGCGTERFFFVVWSCNQSCNPCDLNNHHCDSNATCTGGTNNNHTCECNEGFSGNGTICEEIECDPPGEGNNTDTVSTIDLGIDDEYIYTCMTGYMYSGPAADLTTVCELNDDEETASWSNLPPTCEEIECDPPGEGNNTDTVSTNELGIGDVYNYSCLAGYMYAGCEADLTTVCEPNEDGLTASWSNPPPSCEDIDECEPCNDCPDHSNCSNTMGNYTCDCDYGFIKVNGSCEANLNCSQMDNLDGDLTDASSIRGNYPPSAGFLNDDTGWRPRSDDSRPYWQYDFGSRHTIVRLKTQGSRNQGASDDPKCFWTQSYEVECQVTPTDWQFIWPSAHMIFLGANHDATSFVCNGTEATDSIVRNDMPMGVVCYSIRLYPRNFDYFDVQRIRVGLRVGICAEAAYIGTK